MTSEELIKRLFEEFQKGVVSNLPKVTGKTAASVRTETGVRYGRLFGAKYIDVLETGRPPTRNGKAGQPTLREIILQWIKDKGIKPEGISQKSLAFLIARKIHREGTKLYRSGGQSGVFSTVITEQRLRTFEKELAGINAQAYASKLLRQYNNFFSE